MVEPSQPAPPQEGQYRLQLTPSPELGDTPRYYSNFVQANFTPHDLTIHFGWYMIPPFGDPPPTGSTIQIPIERVAKVTLPLTLVRGLIQVLQTQADGWERNLQQNLPDVEAATEEPT